MTRNLLKYISLSALLLIVWNFGYSQTFPTYTVTTINNPSPGYLLTTPVNYGYITILDNSGQVAYYRDLRLLGKNYNSLRILENGRFAYFDIMNNKWLLSDNDFNIVDSIKAVGNCKADFHSLHSSSSGNYLLVALNTKTVNMRDKIDGGNPAATIENNVIQEVDADGNLLFEWDCIEHIDVLSATKDIDLKANVIDPFHVNQAIYDSDGNILANFRNLDAIIKINKATGDILWIMGGSESKINQFNFSGDTRDGFFGFSHQHDPQRLPNGNIILYDNGNLKPTHYSRAVEYQIDERAKVATRVWEYRVSPDAVASWTGSVQRLPNGNTMIGWGSTNNNTPDVVCTEVTPAGTKAFEMRYAGYRGHYQVLRKVFKMNSVTHNISSSGGYNFNNETNTTGIFLNVNSVSGSGFTSVEKHNYAPRNIVYATEQSCNFFPYRWVISNSGFTSFSGRIFIDLSSFPDLQAQRDIKLFYRKTEGQGAFTIIESTYNSAYNRIEANITAFGEFFLGYTYFFGPKLSSPTNEATQVSTAVPLRWKAPRTGCSYRIQISESRDFNNTLVDTSGLSVTDYYPKNLESIKTYYWRVKAFDGSCESSWSDINSFTTIINTPNTLEPSDQSKNVPLDFIMKWSSVKGAESYTINVSKSSNFTKLDYEQICYDTTYWHFFKFEPQTKYYWRVSAGTNKVYGNWSQTTSFTSSNGKIYLWQPSDSSTGFDLDGKLKWEYLGGIDIFRVQIAKDSLFTKIISDSNGIKKYEYACSGLENSTRYYWRVKGYFRDTATEWSDVWFFNTNLAAPVQTFPEDNALNVLINGNLKWSEVKNADYYELKVSIDSNFKNNQINEYIKTSQFNYFSSYLQPEQKYYWKVRAYEGKHSGDWSVVRCFTVQDMLILPENNSYTVNAKTLFTWNALYGDGGYDIVIATDSSFSENAETFMNINDTFYVAEHLKYNTKYFWTVKKGTSKSDWAPVHSFTTEIVMPVLLYPNDHQISDSNTITLKWTCEIKPETYHLQIARDSLFTELIVDSNSIMDDTLLIPSGFPEGPYSWRVKALDGLNSSQWTKERSFRIEKFNIPLISPNGGEVWYRSGTDYSIRWSTKLGDSVRIELLKDGNNYKILEENYTNTEHYYNWKISKDTPLDSNYQVKVKSLSNQLLHSVSSYFFAISEIVTVNDNLSEHINLIHYPNPVEDLLTFEIDSRIESYSTLKIYDLKGIEIAILLNDFIHLGKQKIIWNTTKFGAGTYRFIFISNELNFAGTIIVVK